MEADIQTLSRDESYLDHCTDLDSHEMAPLQLWAEVFGEEAREFITLCERGEVLKNNGSNTLFRPDLLRDDAPIDERSVWFTRGPAAPSAFDFDRRHEVMDVMGIEKQLVYPGYGLVGTMLAYHPFAAAFWQIDTADMDMIAMAKRAIRIHNDWCLRVTREMGDRIRPC